MSDVIDAVGGRVKWYDETRGYGFVTSEAVDGDVLLHHSILRQHNRREIPEGARIEFEFARGERGFQVTKIHSFDLRGAVAPRIRIAQPSAASRIEGSAGEFEPVSFKWFSHRRGDGFVSNRGGEDVFVHAQVLGPAGLIEDATGALEARIGRSPKGLVAVEVRRIGA